MSGENQKVLIFFLILEAYNKNILIFNGIFEYTSKNSKFFW